jgi:photosystem II stability/assembly factor-like uncharacterized protein
MIQSMKTIIPILSLTTFLLISTNLLPAQWIQQNSGTIQSLTDVVMLDTATAIAVGRDRSFLRTTDCGSSWIDVGSPLSFIQPWNAVDFCDTLNGVVVGEFGGIVVTSNSGKNWLPRYIKTEQKCLSVLQLSPGHFFVGADSGWIYETADTGQTWTSEKISTYPIRALFEWRGTYTLGLPIYALTPHSLFCNQQFPLDSWEETILLFQGFGSEAYNGEFCNGGGAGFIIGLQGDDRAAPTILRKFMTDTTWYNVSPITEEDGIFLGVAAPTADVIYVCGTGGMIYKSTDGGDTWIASITPTTQNLNAIYFYDENHGFAVGDSGVILHTFNGGLTGIDNQENQLPTKFVLNQNYPNPFNQVTNISFSLTGRSFVSLKVYDLAGREVSSLVAEELPAGEYVRQWNAAGFPSGIYFYQLQSGSSFVTKKLVLLK